MGLFGDTNIWSMVRRIGVGNMQVMHTCSFTTAGTGAPTVDGAKTRGPIAVARTGVGVYTITLPKYLRNSVAVASMAAGGEVQDVNAVIPEASAVCTVTFVTSGTNTAVDSTGNTVNVVIWGTQR